MTSFSPDRYLRKQTRFEDFKLLESFEGENNQNFIFESKGAKYVLRKKKEISEQESLENEKRILEFLEYKGIDLAPNSISFDSEERIHIVSFVGKEGVDLEELNSQELEKWTKNLAEINRLTFEDYREFCEKQDYNYSKPVTQEEFERLQEDINSLEDSGYEELLQFSGDVIKSLKNDWDEGEVAGQELILAHSDIANSTRRTDDNFYFIDWEFASFKYNPLSDIAILFTQTKLAEDQKSTIKETYRSKVNVSEFEQKILWAQKFRHVFNIIWCLKRASNSESNDKKNKYLNYAQSQKKDLSELIR